MRSRSVLIALILVPAALYAAICVTLYFAQAKLLFPVAMAGQAPPLPPGAERLELRAESGELLAGLHIPPAEQARERLLILGFSGNATNAGTTATLLHHLYPGADVVAFHYRGYPPSEGSPGAAAFVEDAERILDFTRARLRPARTILAGFSVGSGVAATLAARRRVDGLILVTPFDSLGAVAAGHYPWLPVRLLFRHELDSAEALRGSRIPVAILAAASDRLVVPERTQALRVAIPHLAFDRTIAEADHNDIYSHTDFPEAMRQALAALGVRS
jgi:pimeloyl-ACP methyl ester carboxylesterase